MSRRSWLVRTILALMLCLSAGSLAACSGSGDNGPREDCSVYKTKRFKDACNERNKNNKGSSSDNAGRGPCKYGGKVITSDPGTRAKQRLASELRKSNCITTSDNVCDGKAGKDFSSGRLDWRLYQQLQRINRAKYKVGISCLWTGHSKYVSGTDKISLHYLKQGMDFNFVNGQQVNGFGDEVADLADWLTSQPNGNLTDEVGLPPRYLDGVKRTKASGKGPFFAENGAPHFHFGVR